MEFSRESQTEKLLENNMGIHDSSCLNGNIIGKKIYINVCVWKSGAAFQWKCKNGKIIELKG